MRANPRPLFQTCYMASHTSNISDPPPLLQTWIRPCTLMTSQTQQITKSRCLQTTVLYHPDKCLVMNISKKRHPSKFTYSLHNTDLKTTDTAKYLGIIISQYMKWTKHITQIVHVPIEHYSLDSSKEMSKYDPLALRRNYRPTTAWFARMSNMLQQYGPLMR